MIEDIEKVKSELMKLHKFYPFREWYAIKIEGEWRYYDSKNKVKKAMREAGIKSADIVAMEMR